MQIGIVNAGNIGLQLTASWVREGHEVMLSKDPNPAKLAERVQRLVNDKGLSEAEQSRIHVGTLVEAANFSDIVLFSVYFPRLGHVLKQLQDAGVTLEGKTVVDTMNPLNVDANFNHYHDSEYMAKTSTTEDVLHAFPQAKVFKAFSTLPSDLLDAKKWKESSKQAMLYLGGDAGSSEMVRQLIKDAGFRPIFAGYEVQDAKLLEKMGVLLHRISVNEFDGDLGLAFNVGRYND